MSGASGQEVDNIDVAADVRQDLELRLEGVQLGAVTPRLDHLDGGGDGVGAAQLNLGTVHPPEGPAPQQLVWMY